MNFLAHFHLASPDAGLIAGGLEGDYHKGPLRGERPEALERGIKLHRSIDAYTDGHPLVAQLRVEFPPSLRRYAGILIDLSFDHYLSCNWSKYSEVPLPQFTFEVYHKLNTQKDSLSSNAQQMLERLIEHDILNLYHDWNTVPATARRIGQRFKRGNPFLTIDDDIVPAREAMERTFLEFYPQLQEFCEQQRK